MIVEVGEKLHVMYRSLYEKSTRRHFLGQVTAVDGALCRLEGYVFVYDSKTTEFVKKEERRTTLINVADSGVITNVLDPLVELDKVRYQYTQGLGLVATDGNALLLNINEFGSKS